MKTSKKSELLTLYFLQHKIDGNFFIYKAHRKIPIHIQKYLLNHFYHLTPIFVITSIIIKMSIHSERLLKIIVIGNSGVGKTSMLSRYADNTFTTAFYSTMGVDFKMKNIILDGRKVRLQIWDTAGQDKYKSVISSYYKNSHAAMLVYDITDESSFEALRFWQQQTQKYGTGNMVVMVVGSKCDKQEQRKVPIEKAQQYAAVNKFEYIEVSAKNAKNVSQAFQSLSRLMIKRFEQSPPDNKTKSETSTPGKQLQSQRKVANNSKKCYC